MQDFNDAQQWWEVRITRRLVGEPSEATWNDMLLAFKRVEVALGQHSNVASVNVGGVAGATRTGVTAVIVFAEPSSPSDAIERALGIFTQACVDSGVETDTVVEIVAEPGDVDPRSLL